MSAIYKLIDCQRTGKDEYIEVSYKPNLAIFARILKPHTIIRLK